MPPCLCVHTRKGKWSTYETIHEHRMPKVAAPLTVRLTLAPGRPVPGALYFTAKLIMDDKNKTKDITQSGGSSCWKLQCFHQNLQSSGTATVFDVLIVRIAFVKLCVRVNGLNK